MTTTAPSGSTRVTGAKASAPKHGAAKGGQRTERDIAEHHRGDPGDGAEREVARARAEAERARSAS